MECVRDAGGEGPPVTAEALVLVVCGVTPSMILDISAGGALPFNAPAAFEAPAVEVWACWLEDMWLHQMLVPACTLLYLQQFFSAYILNDDVFVGSCC